MGVKSCPANICFFNNFPNGDLVKILLGQKPCECVEDRFPGFSLPSVHTISPICSVMNTLAIPYIAMAIVGNIINSVFGNKYIVSQKIA